MSKVRDTLFGDQGKGAAKAQSQQNAQERQFIQQQTELARKDLNRLYPQMQQNTMSASNAALNVLRGAVPAQVNVANQGASNAMAAILGGQITPINADLSFLQQQMPQMNFDQAPAQGGGNQTIQPALASLLAGQMNKRGR